MGSAKVRKSSGTKRAAVWPREGYQGKPLPAGTKPVPPKGPAADVPVKPTKTDK